MAKAKKTTEGAEEQKPKSQMKDFIAQWNDKITQSAHSFLKRKRIIVPVSPQLNLALRGGIPEGTLTILTGPEKLGKTLTAMQIAANAQDKALGGETCPSGRRVFFYNIEGRLEERDILGIRNLDLDRFEIVGSIPGSEKSKAKILTAEEWLTKMELNIHEFPGSVHIADSFTMLATENELNSGMDEQQRTESQRLLSKFLRRVSNVITVNKILLIGITQIMGNPTGYGGPQEKGGYGIKFAQSNKFRGKSKKEIMVDGKQVGQEVTWEIENSALGPPVKAVVSKIRYGEGLDILGELLSLGSELGVIPKSGTWYTFVVDKEEQKIQGEENARNFLLQHPELEKHYTKEMKELLGF